MNVYRVRLTKDRIITHLRREHAQVGGTDAERRRWSMSELSALHDWAHHDAVAQGRYGVADHVHVK